MCPGSGGLASHPASCPGLGLKWMVKLSKAEDRVWVLFLSEGGYSSAFGAAVIPQQPACVCGNG